MDVGYSLGEDDDKELLEFFNVEEFPSYYLVEKVKDEIVVKKYEGKNSLLDVI